MAKSKPKPSSPFKEIAVAPDATAILWRAGTLPFHAQRVFCLGINWRAALKQYLVFPGITEVIFVLEGEALAGLGQDFAEHHLRGVFALEVVETVVEKFGIAVPLAFDLELVQVGSGPAHRRLNVFVELVERAVLDLDASPDRSLGSKQRDLELEEEIGLRRTTFGGSRGGEIEDLGVFLLEELHHSAHHGQHPLLVLIERELDVLHHPTTTPPKPVPLGATRPRLSVVAYAWVNQSPTILHFAQAKRRESG